MALYKDLFNLAGNDDLRNRCAVAVVVAAYGYLTDGASDAAQKKWALAVLSDPTAWGTKALFAALAANNALSTTQIQQALDDALQTSINAVTAALAAAL